MAGDRIASVAMAPDYMLTVWDWFEEKIALHSKAFGQDVYSVRFSLDDERRLTTCGTGHIRFWKMAATFTGLKLQGSIGKFGKVELSDVAAFVELPDGKVVSGTESGSLLLWEGNFIKARFVQSDGRLCHDGEVTYVELDREDRRLATAGIDGYIRWWSFDVIDAAEVDSDQSMDFELKPMAEYYLGPGKGIRSVVDGGDVKGTRSLYVVDTDGKMQRLQFPLYGDNDQELIERGKKVAVKAGSRRRLSLVIQVCITNIFS
jgi:WD40 repeat protein